MRLFIEFLWAVAEKVGKRYLWVHVDANELSIEELFLSVLAREVGRDVGEALFKLFTSREILVVVNGVIASDPVIKLKDGDKILIQPLASGG